jgi:hypothetical protein
MTNNFAALKIYQPTIECLLATKGCLAPPMRILVSATAGKIENTSSVAQNVKPSVTIGASQSSNRIESAEIFNQHNVATALVHLGKE